MMKYTGSLLAGALMLALTVPQDAAAQMRHGHGMMGQDSTRMGQMMPGMMGMMGGMGHMMPGMSGMMQGMMGIGPAGPGLLLDLEDELNLSREQVTRLETIRDRIHEKVRARAEEMRRTHRDLASAQSQGDWDSAEEKIEALSRLQVELGKTHLAALRETREVLTAAQREQLEAWRQGFMLFRRHMMEQRMEHMPGRMHRHDSGGSGR